MDIKIKIYNPKYKTQIIGLFENFQDYLIGLDSLQRLRRLPGYAENALRENLKEVEERNGIFYVAILNEKVVGFVIGFMEKRSKQDLLRAYPAKMARINELYVDANLRNQGIGALLMNAVEGYFKAGECQFIWIEVFVPNQNARIFYKNLGYQDRDIQLIKKL